VIEKDPQPGGTCLHRGCIPTKAMLHTAALFEEFSKASRFGLQVPEGVRIDPEGALDYRRAVIEKNARGVSYLFRKNGVELRRGRGRVIQPGEVEIHGRESRERVRAKWILVATGSVPKELPSLETDGQRILNSDHVLELAEIPRSLVASNSGVSVVRRRACDRAAAGEASSASDRA